MKLQAFKNGVEFDSIELAQLDLKVEYNPAY